MADTETNKIFNKILEKLEELTKISKAAAGFNQTSTKPVLNKTIKADEVTRLQKIAKITAAEYKKVLGLGYNDRDSENNAKKFKSVFGITDKFYVNSENFLKTISEQITNLVTTIQTSILDELVNLKLGINTISGNTVKGVDYTIILTSIEKLLGDVKLNTTSSGRSSLTLIESLLGDIKTNTASSGKSSTIQFKPRDFINGINFLIKKLDWMPYKDAALSFFKQKDKKSPISGNIGNIAGLALMGAGMLLIVQALISSDSIDVAQTLKVITITGAFVMLFSYIGKKTKDIKEASIGFAIFAATIMLLVIPLFETMANFDTGNLIEGLFKLSVVVAYCMGIIWAMGKIDGGKAKKNTMGLLVFSMTVGLLIIPLLETIATSDMGIILAGMFNLGIVIAYCMGIIWAMGKIKAGDVIKSTLGLLAFTALMQFIVIPFLQKNSVLNWAKIIPTLIISGVAMTIMAGLVIGIGKIVDSNKKIGAIGVISILILTGLLYLLAETLEKFAFKPWPEILIGLGMASTALVAFGVLVGLIGMATQSLLPVMAIGAVAIFAMIYLMGYLADNLVKFKDIDGDNLAKVGIGLTLLGIGLVAFLGGSVAGVAGAIVNKVSSFFGLDPVAKIKEFEKIDADKLLKLGTGLKFMGEGLSMLSNKIDLTGITKQILYLTKPLSEFSGSLDEFTNAYSKFEKLSMDSEMNNVYKMNVEKDSGIQQAILDLNKQEYELQQLQLQQLAQNGEYLKQIVARIGSSESGSPIIAGGSNEKGSGIDSPSFGTKNLYLNNLKLTNMSLA